MYGYDYMSREVLYSVVVPHFNDDSRLARLLRSLPLGRNDLEVIVVDDCSTEVDALNLLRRSFGSVSWLSTQVNSGAGVARNVGMVGSRGRWLLFADSDDEFLPNAFDIFDAELRDSDELVFFLSEGMQELDGSASIRGSGYNRLVNAYAKRPNSENLSNLRLQHVVPWAKIWSLGFIRSTGIVFDSYRFANDRFFSIAAAHEAERIRVVMKPVYRVYRRAGSLTDHRTARTFIKRFETTISIQKRLEARGIRERLPASALIESLRFGPAAAFKIWGMALRSSFRFPWNFVLHPKRWFRLVYELLKRHRETRSLKCESRGKLGN